MTGSVIKQPTSVLTLPTLSGAFALRASDHELRCHRSGGVKRKEATCGSHFGPTRRVLNGALIQREFPVCKDGGESKVLRSRTSPARNQ